MFTLEDIINAHSKVKSGADFPQYIQDLKELGIHSYETFVNDGHTDYYGQNDHKVITPAKYDEVAISTELNAEQFTGDLKAHQAGKTDYPQFCTDCAKNGVHKWKISMQNMTCTYFDGKNQLVLEEKIPAIL